MSEGWGSKRGWLHRRFFNATKAIFNQAYDAGGGEIVGCHRAWELLGSHFS